MGIRPCAVPFSRDLCPIKAGSGGLHWSLGPLGFPPFISTSHAETMSSALARAYAGNPDLNQQRAGVRATDENLPRATSQLAADGHRDGAIWL